MYKYICNDCGHEFNLRSYHKDCPKCQSTNIKQQGGGNQKNVILVVLVVFVIGLLYFMKDFRFSKRAFDFNGKEIAKGVKYKGFHIEDVKNTAARFFLITDNNDTVALDQDLVEAINLKCKYLVGDTYYEFNDNDFLIYPCRYDFKYTFTFDTLLMSPSMEMRKEYGNHIIDNWQQSSRAKCPIRFSITLVDDPTIDNDCRFFVYTNHPDNVENPHQMNPAGGTYFTRGDSAIEISISGKDGPFLKQNEFSWDSTVSQYDIFARAKNDDLIRQYKDPKVFEPCGLEVPLNESGNIELKEGAQMTSQSFDWKKFEKEIKLEVQLYLSGKDKYELQYWELMFGRVQWFLDGKDISARLQMDLDPFINSTKRLNIEVVVSKKGKQVKRINLTTN